MTVSTLSVKLPYYFYNLDSILPDGRPRWRDEFADPYEHIIQPKDLNAAHMRIKAERNIAYSKWIASKCYVTPSGDIIPQLKGKQMKWQSIRVLSFKHSEKSDRDWWERYQDAKFRVFLQPETIYDKITGEHKQWYLLSPEDSYLVNRYEIERRAPSLAPREANGRERFLSADKRLRTARLIPVECCHHLRHETTGGVLSYEEM
jgi:hypothetical protein